MLFTLETFHLRKLNSNNSILNLSRSKKSIQFINIASKKGALYLVPKVLTLKKTQNQPQNQHFKIFI